MTRTGTRPIRPRRTRDPRRSWRWGRAEQLLARSCWSAGTGLLQVGRREAAGRPGTRRQPGRTSIGLGCSARRAGRSWPRGAGTAAGGKCSPPGPSTAPGPGNCRSCRGPRGPPDRTSGSRGMPGLAVLDDFRSSHRRRQPDPRDRGAAASCRNRPGGPADTFRRSGWVLDHGRELGARSAQCERPLIRAPCASRQADERCCRWMKKLIRRLFVQVRKCCEVRKKENHCLCWLFIILFCIVIRLR